MIGLPRVLQSLEVLGLDTIYIRQNGFEGSTPFVSHGMLFVSEPAHEVIHADVVRVFDDVMHDALVGVTFGVKEDGAGFVGKSLEHDTVCGFAAKMTQNRMYKSANFCFSFDVSAATERAVTKFDFASVGAHEVAFFGVRPEDFTVGLIERRLFAAFG